VKLVDIDPSRLQAGNYSYQVNDQNAFNINLSGGRAELGGSEQSIRTLGSAPNVEVLKTIKLSFPWRFCTFVQSWEGK